MNASRRHLLLDPELRAFAHRKAGAQEAEDVLSTAMMARPGDNLSRSYFFGVCANLVRRLKRSRARGARALSLLSAEPPSAAKDPERLLMEHELADVARRALAELPEAQRTTFLRMALEDWSAAEIAARDHVPEATVRSRLFHARRKLREVLTQAQAQRLMRVLVAGVLLAVVLGGAAYAFSHPAVVERVLRKIWKPRAGSIRPPAPPPVMATSPTVAPALFAPEPVHIPVAKPRVQRVPAVDPADVLFDQAQSAHFREHAYADAERLWSAYLARWPRGRFAPEAQYNRVIALLKLGRRAEAILALESFQQANWGDYRRDEVRVLLKSLGSS